ncbi:hypothetical protein NMYAN_100021 [Nitrosomonas nitrosa]|uniref:Uncharacterized protein n=1 Tax=Nitrosomonas nitrosa TaxID=52442 RepID=A0A8H8YWN9_9PROT|nr:hypothetical protein NMYAN_100021 [Nitrosomonas nitrosa]
MTVMGSILIVVLLCFSATNSREHDDTKGSAAKAMKPSNTVRRFIVKPHFQEQLIKFWIVCIPYSSQSA